MNKHDRFDTVVGSIIFFGILVVPVLMLLFGVGDSVQPLGKY